MFDDYALNNVGDVLAPIDRFFQLFIEIFPLDHFHRIASFVKQTAYGALIDVVAVILKTMKFNQALGSGNMLVADKVKLALDISAVKQA